MAQEDKSDRDLHLIDLIDCPKCQHSNAAGTRYCDGCGASLVGVASHSESERESKRKGLLGGLLGRKGGSG